jgi:fructosamine-3-kinase
MIVDRGAVEAALERWNARRRQIFYPKTDLDFDLAAMRRRKEEAGPIAPSTISALLDEEVSSVEFLPNAGTFHALHRIITPAARYILKLALDDGAGEFEIENVVVGKLKAAGLPTTEVRAFNIVPQQLPYPFLICDEAPGHPLNSFENPETQAMPEPILFELGKTIARLHEVQTQRAGFLDAKSLGETMQGLLPDWPAYVRQRLDEHLKICRDICVIDEQEQSLIERQFVRGMDTFCKSPMRLLHGDLGHHNIFSDGQRITAIIDWEDALSGDPIFDVAYWGTFVRDEMRARFLEGYQTVSPLPWDFEYRYWLYYLRIAISKTVHRHHFGTKDRPGRPLASQRIQKALSNLAKL